jgi:hypothetical protein
MWITPVFLWKSQLKRGINEWKTMEFCGEAIHGILLFMGGGEKKLTG